MKEGSVLFNDALSTLYLQLYGVGHMIKNNSNNGRRKPLSSKCEHFNRLAARDLLYASSHRQDSIYHGLCYTSHIEKEK